MCNGLWVLTDSSLFFFAPISINDVWFYHRFLILPGLGIILGVSPQPPHESIWAPAKILIEGRVEESPGGHRPVFSSSLYLGLARGHGSARAHSGGARSRSRYTSRNMWSKQLARFWIIVFGRVFSLVVLFD